MTIDVKADLEGLYSAIMARVSGKAVGSLGHGGRNVSYDHTTLSDMVKLYRAMWRAEFGLPELPYDLADSAAPRGCLHIRLKG